MSSPHKSSTEDLLADLDRAFSIQLDRVRSKLFPKSHSTGSKKPDLALQEAILLGEVEKEEDV